MSHPWRIVRYATHATSWARLRLSGGLVSHTARGPAAGLSPGPGRGVRSDGGVGSEGAAPGEYMTLLIQSAN